MSELLRRAGYFSSLAEVGRRQEAGQVTNHATDMSDGDWPVFDQEQAELGYTAQAALPKETPMPESLLHSGESVTIL